MFLHEQLSSTAALLTRAPLPTMLRPLHCRPACSVVAAAGRDGNALYQCGSQQDIDDFLQLLNYQRALHGWAALVA